MKKVTIPVGVSDEHINDCLYVILFSLWEKVKPFGIYPQLQSSQDGLSITCGENLIHAFSTKNNILGIIVCDFIKSVFDDRSGNVSHRFTAYLDNLSEEGSNRKMLEKLLDEFETKDFPWPWDVCAFEKTVTCAGEKSFMHVPDYFSKERSDRTLCLIIELKATAQGVPTASGDSSAF